MGSPNTKHASQFVPFTVACYGFYNIFLHPLRRHPGPLLWRAYLFPYVISIHRGDIHRRMRDFHQRYGPIVRISPNELSYVDGAAWKDIYANRPGHLPFKRNTTWVKKMRSDEPERIMGQNEESHARLRRAFANAFSEKSLKDQSPIIQSYVDACISQFKGSGSVRSWKEKKIDLNDWFYFLTFDITGDLSFGESFECVKNGKAHYWVEVVQDFGKGLALVATINQYPPIDKLLRYVIPKKILQRQLDHRQMSAEKARKRLAMNTDRPDFITATMKSSDQKAAISQGEWEVNMSTIVLAGSETSSSALSGIMRELVQNRGVLHRLTQEVRDTFEVESDITISSTGNLAYLNAVINEGLRLCPPVVIGVPRVVPKGGDTVCGQWIPGGVSINTIGILIPSVCAEAHVRYRPMLHSITSQRLVKPTTSATLTRSSQSASYI